jgi:hypothetical protein
MESSATGLITFHLSEEDIDALAWVAIEAKSDSRDLYDRYTDLSGLKRAMKADVCEGGAS